MTRNCRAFGFPYIYIYPPVLPKDKLNVAALVEYI